MSDLADDTVVGVRIGVARLLGFISGSDFQDHGIRHGLHSSSGRLSGFPWDLVRRLSQDDSYEVRSYILSQLDGIDAHIGLADKTRAKVWTSNIFTFSRPPPSRRPAQQVGRTDANASRTADCLVHVNQTLNYTRGDIDLDNGLYQDTLLGSGNSLPSSTAPEHISDVGRRNLIGEGLQEPNDNPSTMFSLGNNIDVESKPSMPVPT